MEKLKLRIKLFGYRPNIDTMTTDQANVAVKRMFAVTPCAAELLLPFAAVFLPDMAVWAFSPSVIPAPIRTGMIWVAWLLAGLMMVSLLGKIVMGHKARIWLRDRSLSVWPDSL